jgi:hypothetical protein
VSKQIKSFALLSRNATHFGTKYSGESTDSARWRQGMELHRLADLSSIAPLKSQLRTPSLRPAGLLSGARTEAERQELVQSVIEKRSGLVRGEGDGQGGRLLIYAPDESLADGAAIYPSKGFFDVDNTPPWDTWVAFSRGILLSLVPLKLVELAQSGIYVNPESCIRWFD